MSMIFSSDHLSGENREELSCMVLLHLRRPNRDDGHLGDFRIHKLHYCGI